LHFEFCILHYQNQQRLRVGIDGRAFSSPAPGIRRYVEGLVPALLALEDAPEVVALGGLPEAVPPQIPHVGERLHPPTNAGWTLVGLPRAAAEARVDVLHAPAYTAPFWSPVPVVLTIHDIRSGTPIAATGCGGPFIDGAHVRPITC
jgi:hypothetical protein